MKRLCGECGASASFVVEPVGRYDFLGWADMPACEEHLGAVVQEYMDEMPRVQVRFCDVPSQPAAVSDRFRDVAFAVQAPSDR